MSSAVPPRVTPTSGTTPGPGAAAASRTPRPSLAWWLAAGVIGAASVAWSAEVGLWYLPMAEGVLLGAASRLWRPGPATTAGVLLLIGPAGWGIPLAWMALRGAAVAATARTVAALAGLPGLAGVTIAVTLLVPLLEAAAGLWIGRALTPRGRPAAAVPERSGLSRTSGRTRQRGDGR
jgi:hypothetical protein